jgi:hypothetical protein
VAFPCTAIAEESVLCVLFPYISYVGQAPLVFVIRGAVSPCIPWIPQHRTLYSFALNGGWRGHPQGVPYISRSLRDVGAMLRLGGKFGEHGCLEPVLVSVWRLLLGNVLPIGKRCS